MEVLDEVDRIEDAVERAGNVRDDRAERQRDEQRVPADESQALEDLVSNRRRRRPGWTRRLGAADQAERDRRDAEGDRVDEDRERCADELDEAALVEILTKPRNAILKQYQRLFEYEGVRLLFSEDASRAVAREALARKVGARGLRMILEELMLDLMYHLPSNKKIKELDITAEMVQKRDLSVTLLEKAG